MAASVGGPKVPQAVALLGTRPDEPFFSLPWGHHVVLMEKVKNHHARRWYVESAVTEGWSRDVLTGMITSEAHQRQGSAITNFSSSLPEPQSDLARGALKDPYVFDFLTLEAPFRECQQVGSAKGGSAPGTPELWPERSGPVRRRSVCVSPSLSGRQSRHRVGWDDGYGMDNGTRCSSSPAHPVVDSVSVQDEVRRGDVPRAPRRHPSEADRMRFKLEENLGQRSTLAQHRFVHSVVSYMERVRAAS